MANFLDSFQKGIKAAEIAQENEKEIDLVFQTLNEQLNRASDGTVNITKGQRFIDGDLAVLSRLVNFKDRETENVIKAFNPRFSMCNPQVIAKWEMDKNGYPFYITFDNRQTGCQNKEALEKCLERLLSNASVGKKLYAIMKFETPKDENSETN